MEAFLDDPLHQDRQQQDLASRTCCRSWKGHQAGKPPFIIAEGPWRASLRPRSSATRSVARSNLGRRKAPASATPQGHAAGLRLVLTAAGRSPRRSAHWRMPASPAGQGLSRCHYQVRDTIVDGAVTPTKQGRVIPILAEIGEGATRLRPREASERLAKLAGGGAASMSARPPRSRLRAQAPHRRSVPTAKRPPKGHRPRWWRPR